MRGGAIGNDNGVPSRATRSVCHKREITREFLQGIVDTEKRAIAANLLCLALIAISAMRMPNAADYSLALIFRVIAVAGTRAGFARMRAALESGADHERVMPALGATLLVGGASWASVLLPVVDHPFIDPGRMFIAGGVMVGVSIVVSLLAPSLRLAAAFCVGFLAVFLWGIADAPSAYAANAAVGMLGLFALFVTYGYATVASQRQAAEAIVRNRALSAELSAALTRAEFLAYRDPLTGLMNRRAFFQHAHEADSTDAETRHVISIDLDHFKLINDRFGHAMGDSVLVAVGNALRGVIGELPRGNHCAVRLGGEEFALIVAIADTRVTMNVAEIVRHAIALVARAIGEPGLVTTASIGLCAWHPGEDLDHVLSKADAALYQAKVGGRDRIVRVRAARR